MKGFPKTMATGADLLNCLALVQAGQLNAADLTAAVAAIEEREYITIPILEMSADRKTVTIADCAELAAGVAIENATSTAINAVERPQRAATVKTPELSTGGKATLPSGSELTEEKQTAETTAPEPEDAQVRATLTLSKALPSGAKELRIKAPRNPFEELGTTRQKIDAIKEVLKQYE